ncbi:hypothetical protein LTS10_013073 [Elasticomyces elasticus]|nr:hypothetical protein LTS10_013073 [Elasticomyces elasticus]
MGARAYLSRDRRLCRLDWDIRTRTEETLAQKLDGMFRWVYCQLQVLKAFQFTRPSSIKEALRTLPKDLDETYNRMLSDITEVNRPHALTLLGWLAYAARGLPSLTELAEAGIVDPTDDTPDDGILKTEHRGGLETHPSYCPALSLLTELTETLTITTGGSTVRMIIQVGLQ